MVLILAISSQTEALKSKLASAEQQVADLQRREVEARAEINMLTSSMSSQQQHHHQVRGDHMSAASVNSEKNTSIFTSNCITYFIPVLKYIP